MTPNTWFDAVSFCHQRGYAYTLVTVLSAAGSTPRELGAKMVITGDSQFDTIGGGHLEFEAVHKAREFLVQGKEHQHVESYPLASRLGQCCGGAVKLLFEVKVLHCQTVAIFGAGHVAQALIPILAQLPLQIKWIDSRSEAFAGVNVPSHVTTLHDEQPEGELLELADNSMILVLTHDHQLDYRIVEAALKRATFPYVGMIGSDTKAKRFMTKLQHRGFTENQLNSFVSPVGELSIPGKLPMEVAVSISAQIIQRIHAASPTKNAQNKSKEVTV
ncbi:xanthine dehydrogenase accessory protein XdhC [Alteromonas sp. C1M14]|uniref:xanthine dehydrogenase accessory protein XdhC n=1 Tax=Alteromonas sp. C1M14 TaxID=2841567 RepID=UPI001C0A2ED4|nr:xanthine dehydrogenase accessory protein XdhC [Alteromonas sp. C1M14]MBU2978926.1 xanthine dehydrogenase accessory protein XdhC [Alteromonas sp. C1M14]